MNRLAELILKKSLDDCTIEELQCIADKYPYFNAGHLLTAAKTNLSSDKKAELHFHPVLLSALVNKSGNVVVTEKQILKPAFISPAETTMEKAQEIINEQETVSTNETELVTIPIEETIPEQTQPEPRIEISEANIEEPIAEKQPEPSNQQPVAEEPVIQEQATNFQQPVTSNEQPAFADSSNETFAKLEASAGKPATENQQQETSNPIAFEPYHTVDYFASQGIKVKLEENSDKLSKQLRSFTEWLKTMKKLPAATENNPANIPTEKKVEQLAETSITDSNVETEAMAEVWIKQGNTEKAIEIYRKLSLLEPSKSPYFASRISAIKNN